MSDRSSDSQSRLAEAELIRALAAFLYPPAPEHEPLAELLGLPAAPTAAQYSDMFLLQVHPYASVYLSDNGMKGGPVRDRTDGFWRAVGHEPPRESDHLGALMGLLAGLVEAGTSDHAEGRLTGHAADALRREFLDGWLGVFLDAVDRADPTPFHGEWAGLVRRWGSETHLESSALQDPGAGRDAGETPPEVRMPDERGIDGFVADLLAPGRSGVVVIRRELERLASREGMAFRAGTRASVLETLIKQAPAAALGWLGDTAQAWSALHLVRDDHEWAQRAETTRALARAMGAALDTVSPPA